MGMRFSVHAPQDAEVASRTCGGNGIVRAHEAQVHGQESPAHIVNGKRYAEGVHPPEALQAQRFYHAQSEMQAFLLSSVLDSMRMRHWAWCGKACATQEKHMEL